MKIILPVGLYGCESWSVTFRDGYSVRVSVNRVLRKIICLGGRKKQKAVENCIMKNLMVCKGHEIL